MSGVKRYDPDTYAGALWMEECEGGEYVLASDYDQLKAHNEAITRQLEIANGQIYGLCQERDTLRTQLAEANDALGKKNARIAEYAERHLKDSELLDEARELLEEVRTLECRGVDMAHLDAWLEANK